MSSTNTTEYDRAIAALVALPDDELAAFVCKLDAALKEARAGTTRGLDDATTIAASARILLRSRRAAVAGDRARAIVGGLLGAEGE